MSKKNRLKKKEYKSNHSHVKLSPLNEVQSNYIDAIRRNDIVIGAGSAGTGKTYIASVLAAEMYMAGLFESIIITRPTVPCGEDLGSLPGTLDEKFDPWVVQVSKPIQQVLGSGRFQCDSGRNIHSVPMQYMRGMTFDHSFIIVDEAQNLTVEQARMICTRIGLGSKLVICGDTSQSDVGGGDGLKYLIGLIEKYDRDIPIIKFTLDDCVRGPSCKRMLRLFEHG